MFHTELENPLPCAYPTRYRGLAYDGCHFFCTTACQPRIVALDLCFQETARFDTCRTYSCLCYDMGEDCFWAADPLCPATLYKLSRCFCEIDALHICLPAGTVGAITGISYNCCEDTLLVSCGAGIVRVKKTCAGKSQLLTKSGSAWMLSVVSLCPYYLCYCVVNGSHFLRIYGKTGALLRELALPCGCGIEGAVFFPSKKDFNGCHFYVLLSKCHCYPTIADCVVDLDGLCRNLCECNYALCGKKCHPDDHPHHGSGCNDVLESIAYMEASLAHILNAEGEKLQKIIADSDDICQILEANSSVQKTLERATHLEFLLCNKLETLTESCDFGCHKPPCREKTDAPT